MDQTISFHEGKLIFSVSGRSYEVTMTDGVLETRYDVKQLNVLNESMPVAQVPYRERSFLRGQFSPPEDIALIKGITYATLIIPDATAQRIVELRAFGFINSDLMVAVLSDSKTIDPLEKCKICGHAYADHYKFLPLAEGEAPTPKHMAGVCSVENCKCEKFVNY
ncbi:hypothetical protein M1506_03070 [Patescibacteria group bacterium]|nr:hypothetical protein [Patescibacteria group bacterium]